MFFKLLLLVLLWSGLTKVASILLAVNLVVATFGKRIFASLCNSIGQDYNIISHALKVELFTELNEMKAGETIDVLEIGGGSGTNFKYWKRNARVQVLEPNPHFVKYFEETRKGVEAHLKVQDLLQGFGEDLAAAGIKDSSVDCVVMTLVLCSVANPVQCIQEILRVLKPGGKFFYMEHIAAEKGSLTEMVQKILMTGGFWKFIGDGCCLDRRTDMLIKDAGFSSVVQTRYKLPLPKGRAIRNLMAQPITPHLRGVATK